jgi:demethylmenaquinone methyltransferase / 2-methoxy-6-polyprenyl-1,4-benzoquinol methylase
VSTPLPQGAEKARAVTAMFDRIAPRYDLVNRIMTMGMDVGWRRRAVAALSLPEGARVADLACGTGDLCVALRARGYRPAGIDISAGMLERARVATAVGGAFVRADISRLPLRDGSVDGATCGFALRNVVDLTGVLAEAARVLRPGGRIALLEVAQPDSPLLRWGHEVYFTKVVPRIGAVLSDAAAYRYLPRSVAYLPPTPTLIQMVVEAGFEAVRRDCLSRGIAQLLTGTRR